ncbi:Hpt domain-containing protein [Mesobacterium pallidum]|uniref:Hpt domain-containing protein n=1 Tax=Mesobacterium pallidum TaxID=2872037 RepID=UPI001EE367D5|nr:Hpt domain-containing protein [Mesobacterium pallidum]
MIDWARVSELREEIGAEDFDDVVDIFLEEVEDTIAQLKTSAPDDYESLLHFLKGSALNLGFVEFSNLCQRGEFLSAGGKGPEVDVGEVIASFNASKDQFMTQLKKRFAA